MPLLFSIVIIILACGVLYWLIGSAPFIPEPFKGFAQWFVLAACVIWAFSVLLGYASPFPVFIGRRG